MNDIKRHYSTYIIALIGMLAGLQEALPVLKAYLPEGWVPVLAVVAILAKLYKQNLPKE